LCNRDVPAHYLLVKAHEMSDDFPFLPPVKVWDYDMKREAQEILPNLYLGPFGCARDLDVVRRVGITHIVVVRSVEESRFLREKFVDDGIRYLTIDARDSPFENMIRHFKPVSEFINSVLSSSPSHKILVHGNAGLSRSSTLVAAYIIARYGLSTDETLAYILTRRHCCAPHEGFKNQLREYEALCR
ncbi:Serine/threonine/tyrosine-interacting protein, putative, partial [Perkinsus marinus ATCC 50983]